ncbi:hypothetical protein JCM8547_003295 [Rhodosporidiobolus lusitaniae]
MCINSTSLFFGVAVRTWTLARAIDAWPVLKPAFLVFNLVSLRLRRGTLSVFTETSKTSAIERVPVEMCELIKEELVDLELAEAEKKLVEGFCCVCRYHNSDTDEYDFSQRFSSWEKEVEASSSCHVCVSDSLYEWCGTAESLLNPLGLAISGSETLRSTPSWQADDAFYDPFCATFLHLLLHPRITQTMTLIPSVIRTFRLEPLMVLDDTRTAVEKGRREVPDKRGEVESRFEVLKLGEVDPQWTMTVDCSVNGP